METKNAADEIALSLTPTYESRLIVNVRYHVILKQVARKEVDSVRDKW